MFENGSIRLFRNPDFSYRLAPEYRCNLLFVMKILGYRDIGRTEWSRLVVSSSTGTWFQTPEAFDFYASQPELFKPFAIGICNLKFETINAQSTLRAICVGYVTVERNPITQYFTRRAIIIGGPALADDATDEEVVALLETVKTKTRHLQSLNSALHETTHQSACMQAFRQPEDLSPIAVEQQDASQKHAALTKNTKNIFYCYEPIYIETRNFNDYSRWKGAFEKAGFEYKRHLNFHVDCTDKEKMWERLSKTRQKQIRRALRSGVEVVEPAEEDVKKWYAILQEMYRQKVKLPLLPMDFFLNAYRSGNAKYLMVKYKGEVIGGLMFEMDEKSVYEWYVCGLDSAYERQYPSVVATYAGMEYANAHGRRCCDLMGAGEPGVPYGVRDFKERFGGQLVEHGRFVCVREPILYKIGVLSVKMMRG